MDVFQFKRVSQLERDIKILHSLATELIEENEEFQAFIEKIIDFVTDCRLLLSRASESEEESRTIIISDNLFLRLLQYLDSIEMCLGCQRPSMVSGLSELEAEMAKFVEDDGSGSAVHIRRTIKL
ncbi:MAG: hypothetical protein WCI45_09495 [Desulfuromonadales bacterium]